MKTPALYIVRKHDKHKPWLMPVYFSASDNGEWIEGTFKHAGASILTHEEAQKVAERYPHSVLLRVG